MKPLSIITAVVLLSCTQPEDKVRAGLLFHEAETLAFEQRHAEALQKFRAGIKLDPWSFLRDMDAFTSTLAIGDTVGANAHLRAGVKHGLALSAFGGDEHLQNFLTSPSSKPFRDNWILDGQEFGAIADSAFIRQLDSLMSEDQRIRSNGIGSLDRSTDSLNFEFLIHRFERSGFPDPRTLGHSIGDLELLLWHHRGKEYPGSSQWQRALPHIRKAIDAGVLAPSFMAPFDDFAAYENGGPMPYGTLLCYFREVPERIHLVDQETLDRNRASIGQGPISRQAIRCDVDLRQVRFTEKP